MMMTALGSSGSSSTFPVGPACVVHYEKGCKTVNRCDMTGNLCRSDLMESSRLEGHARMASFLPRVTVQYLKTAAQPRTCHGNLITGLGVTQEVGAEALLGGVVCFPISSSQYSARRTHSDVVLPSNLSPYRLAAMEYRRTP